MFAIVEKFITLSGEAPVPGRPVLHIRFAGCNLSCTYCDTPYRDEVNETMSLSDLQTLIVNETASYPGLSVLLTGGEPLFNDRTGSILELVKGLPSIDFYIETNGSCEIPSTELSNIHFVPDWKAPSSGHGESFLTSNLDAMKPGRDCIKFIIAADDLGWTLSTIKFLSGSHPGLDLYISPQWGKITAGECAEFIINNRLPVSLSMQVHKIIWGERRGV